MKSSIKISRGSKGQALVEAALIAPLIVFFLFTIIWFGSVMLTWQQLVGAARYGTDLIAYTPLSKNAIKQDIINYLCHERTVGRILDKNKLDIDVETKDAVPINFTLSIENIFSSNFVSMVKTVKDISMFPDKSYVEVRYKYRFPRVISAISGREEFWLKARSELLSGDASAGYKKRQS
jgi:Flp pilus assembly protein TadG